jgi:hypothetical protein
MTHTFRSLFVDHPASVEESYFEHMRFAFGFAGLLLLAGAAALVHALIPGLCKTTASQITRRLYARIEHRGTAPSDQVA